MARKTIASLEAQVAGLQAQVAGLQAQVAGLGSRIQRDHVAMEEYRRHMQKALRMQRLLVGIYKDLLHCYK